MKNNVQKEKGRVVTVCCPACNRWSSLSYLEKAVRTDHNSFRVVSSIMHGLGRGRGFSREEEMELGVSGLSAETKVAMLKKLKTMVSLLELDE